MLTIALICCVMLQFRIHNFKLDLSFASVSFRSLFLLFYAVKMSFDNFKMLIELYAFANKALTDFRRLLCFEKYAVYASTVIIKSGMNLLGDRFSDLLICYSALFEPEFLQCSFP